MTSRHEAEPPPLATGQSGPIRRTLTRYRFLTAHLIYGGTAALSFIAAYLLRFEFSIPEEHLATALSAVPLLVFVRFLANWGWRLGNTRWRFIGTPEVVRLAGAILTGSALFALIAPVFPFATSIPRSVHLIEGALTTLGTAGIWIGYRLWFESSKRSQSNGVRPRRVILIGAGDAASLLAREMVRAAYGYRIVGFVDDDPLMWGTSIQGVPVAGSPGDLPAIAEKLRADELIIAIPSAGPEGLRRIVERCEKVNLPFKVLPGIREVLGGDVAPSRLRELRIDDLLGRDPISLELPELEADLEGKVALVTGAAGSIGSELARQIAANRPACLILLDQSESGIFFVERELRDEHPDLELVVAVGDILDRSLVDRLFRDHDIQRVYHAAAYKHVPLMETNVRSAVLNNILGTWRIAEAAGRYGAGKFVLISTDKAVRPSNVMGMTKRMAEIVVTSCHERFPGTGYMAVRFGNVLGSSGSVVPIFRRQLEEGKPITVTDPEVTRYFMTIAEAVQLVLQASLLSRAPGKVAMLDMGEPVRIVELARNMIRLTGKRPDIDIPIVFTGLRPGEKLHEELAAPDEQTEETEIGKVRLVAAQARGPILTDGVLDRIVAELEGWTDAELAVTNDEGRERLLHLLDGCRPVESRAIGLEALA